MAALTDLPNELLSKILNLTLIDSEEVLHDDRIKLRTAEEIVKHVNELAAAPLASILLEQHHLRCEQRAYYADQDFLSIALTCQHLRQQLDWWRADFLKNLGERSLYTIDMFVIDDSLVVPVWSCIPRSRESVRLVYVNVRPFYDENAPMAHPQIGGMLAAGLVPRYLRHGEYPASLHRALSHAQDGIIYGRPRPLDRSGVWTTTEGERHLIPPEIQVTRWLINFRKPVITVPPGKGAGYLSAMERDHDHMAAATRFAQHCETLLRDPQKGKWKIVAEGQELGDDNA